MKKLFCIILSLCLFMPCFVISGSANESTEEYYYFEDGSYLIIYTSEGITRNSGSKTASRTYTYKESDGDVSWKAVLQGTFTYTGSTATCTSSNCTVTIYDTSWYQVSKVVGRNEGTAAAELTMGYKVLGITTKKVPLSMSLTCDSNGNLS